jgi:hypothetical protein
MGKKASPSEVGDIELEEAKLESEATLKVYVAGAPAVNRATTIDDSG